MLKYMSLATLFLLGACVTEPSIEAPSVVSTAPPVQQTQQPASKAPLPLPPEAFMEALIGGNTSILHYLLDENVPMNTDAAQRPDRSLLVDACLLLSEQRNVSPEKAAAVIKRIIPRVPHPLSRETALRVGAYAGNIACVTQLTEAKTDINTKDTTWGWTPAMWASAGLRYDTRSWLMDAGADFSLRDCRGRTADDLLQIAEKKLQKGKKFFSTDDELVTCSQVIAKLS